MQHRLRGIVVNASALGAGVGDMSANDLMAGW